MKLRAWNPESKEMEFYSLTDLVGKDQAFYDHRKWMRFTGVTDRNGHDIYESDFLGNDTEGFIRQLGGNVNNMLVSTNLGTFSCGRCIDIPHKMDTYVWVVAAHLEVAGNLYETPHLMVVSGWDFPHNVPDVQMELSGEQKPCNTNSGAIQCGFCDRVIVPNQGKLRVTDACKGCGAKVVTING